MKVVILAGGFGSRISEYSKKIPKPMITVGDKPLLWHIMKTYSKHNFTDFIIALGYKGQIIKNYFKSKKFGWNIQLVNTGANSMTGGRILRLKEFLTDDRFMLTYGDGLANVNIKKLLSFHKKNKKMVTVTAVRPPARFGSLEIKNNIATNFREKSSLDVGWINGGFFVMERKFLKYIKNDKTILEREPLIKVSKQRQLAAFKHNTFWQCMDTKRDLDLLRSYWKKNNPRWLK
jgi:glucose-1-phosphate cytidylyltransferase